MSPVRPYVVDLDDVPLEGWNDPIQGNLSWRTALCRTNTPTDSLTAGIAIIPPGDGILKLHRHDPAELYFILSGEGIVTIDGVEHHVRKGTTVFIPGNAEHGARATGAEALSFFYAFAVDGFDQFDYRFTPPT